LLKKIARQTDLLTIKFNCRIAGLQCGSCAFFISTRKTGSFAAVQRRRQNSESLFQKQDHGSIVGVPTKLESKWKSCLAGITDALIQTPGLALVNQPAK
jgi:hypothetical protein